MFTIPIFIITKVLNSDDKQPSKVIFNLNLNREKNYAL